MLSEFFTTMFLSVLFLVAPMLTRSLLTKSVTLLIDNLTNSSLLQFPALPNINATYKKLFLKVGTIFF